MSQGSWLNIDGLFLQYGTQKANPETGGDYLTYGQQRVSEVIIDLTSLSASPQVQSLTTLFPQGFNYQIDKVEVEVDVASLGGTSFSVGLGTFTNPATTYSTVTFHTEASSASAYTTNTYTQSVPAVTGTSNTAFVSALVQASTAAAGDLVSLTTGSTSAGTLIGSTVGVQTLPMYITALASGTYTAGLIRVRIFWKGVGTITF